MFELHGSGDPATFKLVICLEELGIPYSFHLVDLDALDNWSPAHRRLATQGEVPVLIADGLVLTDPGIALLYLAESNPSPKLLPSNLVDRYDVQAANDVFDAAFLTSVNLLGWHARTTAAVRTAHVAALAQVRGRQALAGWSAVWSVAESDQLRRAGDNIAGGVSRLENLLGDRHWLVASSFSVADISAFAALEGLQSLQPDWWNAGRFPRVAAWLERMRHRPAVRGAFQSPSRSAAARHAPPR